MYTVEMRWDDSKRVRATDPLPTLDAAVDVMNQTAAYMKRTIAAGNFDPDIQPDYVQVVNASGRALAGDRITRKAVANPNCGWAEGAAFAGCGKCAGCKAGGIHNLTGEPNPYLNPAPRRRKAKR